MIQGPLVIPPLAATHSIGYTFLLTRNDWTPDIHTTEQRKSRPRRDLNPGLLVQRRICNSTASNLPFLPRQFLIFFKGIALTDEPETPEPKTHVLCIRYHNYLIA